MAHELSSGIVAAPVMPFDETGAIDWKTLERYICDVAAGGPRAIAMNMAVSEVSSLDINEQLETLRRCKAAIGGSTRLLSGLTVTNTLAGIELSKRLVDAGAEGLVIFPQVPAFLGTPTVAMITEYHQAIADTVPVPLLAFQTPFAPYPKGSITALSRIERVVAIKDASFDVEKTLDNIKETNSSPRKIGALTGSDTFILEAMLMGCDGALIGFAATCTHAIVEMHKLAVAGKITEAYAIWNRIGPLARACWRSPLRDYRVRTKYAMVKQGIIPSMKVRAPFPSITDADRAEIDEIFRKHDLTDPRFLPAGAPSAAPRRVAAG